MSHGYNRTMLELPPNLIFTLYKQSVTIELSKNNLNIWITRQDERNNTENMT